MKKPIRVCVFVLLACILNTDKILAGTEFNKRVLESEIEIVSHNNFFTPLNKSNTKNNKLAKLSRKELRKALRVKSNKPVEGSRRHYGGYITGVGIVIFILLILLL